MKAKLRRLWLRLVPKFETLETQVAPYRDADKLIRETAHDPDDTKRWHVSPLEDSNPILGIVYIERRKRITE